jgi:hypothetical protein
MLAVMTKTLSIPDFVQDADERHSGLAEEYSVLTRLVNPVLAEPRSARFDNFRHTVLLQCAIGWHHYNAVVLLLANRFVIPSLVLSRTLFELVVGTLYLIKNPNLLPDFLDHGKLVFYESALAANVTEARLAPIKEECEKIRPRFLQGKKKLQWHKSGIGVLAGSVGLMQAYKVFYQDASGATHADATKTLRYLSRGWVQSLRAFDDGKQASPVCYASFMAVANLFLQVNKALDMGHDDEAKAVLLLTEERYERMKTLARPN